MSALGASIPIGVYRGRGCGISAIGVYENFIDADLMDIAVTGIAVLGALGRQIADTEGQGSSRTGTPRRAVRAAR